MKVIIDNNIPDLTDEELELLKSLDIPEAEGPEFKKQMLGVREIVLSAQIARQLAEAGVTPDELVAMLMKEAGTSN